MRALFSLSCYIYCMNNSLSKQEIFCTVRKEWVVDQPEERVRQALIKHMESLGYPLPLIAVEKKLKQVPHLLYSSEKLPNRRADLIAYAKGIHPSYDLYPLLLVECKAVPLTEKVISQVVGYNHFLKAPYVAIVNQNEIRSGKYNTETKQYQFFDGLAPYSDLTNESWQIFT
jgi:hypothetical protein